MFLLFAMVAYPAPSAWDGLAEGAALKLGVAAHVLALSADTIAREGRIGHLSELRSDADEVARRADVLATLTAEP